MTDLQRAILARIIAAADTHTAPPAITHALEPVIRELQAAGMLDATGRRPTEAGRAILQAHEAPARP